MGKYIKNLSLLTPICNNKNIVMIYNLRCRIQFSQKMSVWLECKVIFNIMYLKHRLCMFIFQSGFYCYSCHMFHIFHMFLCFVLGIIHETERRKSDAGCAMPPLKVSLIQDMRWVSALKTTTCSLYCHLLTENNQNMLLSKKNDTVVHQ